MKVAISKGKNVGVPLLDKPRYQSMDICRQVFAVSG
jgi:hypothetical protein